MLPAETFAEITTNLAALHLEFDPEWSAVELNAEVVDRFVARAWSRGG